MPDSLRALALMAAGFAVLCVAAALVGAGVPPLPAVFPTAVAMTAWYWWDRPHELRRKRREKGQCLACGYDLRGNVSGVCPECGVAR